MERLISVHVWECVTSAWEDYVFSYKFLNHYYEWSIQGIDIRDCEKKKKETLVRRLDVSETNQMEEEEEDEKEKDEMNYPNKKKTLYVPMAIP